MFISIVVVQEMAQSWLALLNRQKSGRGQVNAYNRFQRSIEAISKLSILPFDAPAAEVFEELRAQRLHVGTMDLKIAAICIAHDALLLTRNIVDFAKIPDLQVENWLD